LIVPNPNPNRSEKQDPNPNPKEIVRIPNTDFKLIYNLIFLTNTNLSEPRNGLCGKFDDGEVEGVGLGQTIVPQVVPKPGDPGAGVAHVRIDERHDGEDAAHLGVRLPGEHLDDLAVEVVQEGVQLLGGDLAQLRGHIHVQVLEETYILQFNTK